jgi:hypothetical protein
MARPKSFAPVVQDFRKINIDWLKRKGARPGYSGRLTWSRDGQETGSICYWVEVNGIWLSYRTRSGGGEPEDVNERIELVSTPGPFGGHRQCFSCPSCRRRCRILLGGARFRCRRCYGARYESQHQHAALTVCDRRWRLRHLLEERGGQHWPFGLDDGLPPKPPKMHWKTYRRLEVLDERLAARWRLGVGDWLERHPA